MTEQDYVLSQFPTAECLIKYEPCRKHITRFIITAKEDDDVFFLGSSSVSEKDAWSDAKINIGDGL